MFSDLPDSKRKQFIELCRYFFRSNVMKKHLDNLIEKHGGADKAAKADWDEFWAYFSYWLAGLWVVCEGIDRVDFGDGALREQAAELRPLLHPIRQATFHYKPDTSQMMRYFQNHQEALSSASQFHQDLMGYIGRFLASLPDEFLERLDRTYHADLS
jgi:hypothetical protein